MYLNPEVGITTTDFRRLSRTMGACQAEEAAKDVDKLIKEMEDMTMDSLAPGEEAVGVMGRTLREGEWMSVRIGSFIHIRPTGEHVSVLGCVR